MIVVNNRSNNDEALPAPKLCLLVFYIFVVVIFGRWNKGRICCRWCLNEKRDPVIEPIKLDNLNNKSFKTRDFFTKSAN